MLNNYSELMGSKIFDLLFTHYGTHGELILDFDDVLYMQDSQISKRRLSSIRTLLYPIDQIEGVEILISVEAAKLLCAWGDPLAVDYIEQFVKKNLDKLIGLSCHRVFGYDTIFEELESSLFDYFARVADRSTAKGVLARKKISKTLKLMISLSSEITYDLSGVIKKTSRRGWREYDSVFKKCENSLKSKASKTRVDECNLIELTNYFERIV